MGTPKGQASLLLHECFVLEHRCFHTGHQKHLHCFLLLLHDGLTSWRRQPLVTNVRHETAPISLCQCLVHSKALSRAETIRPQPGCISGDTDPLSLCCRCRWTHGGFLPRVVHDTSAAPLLKGFVLSELSHENVGNPPLDDQTFCASLRTAPDKGGQRGGVPRGKEVSLIAPRTEIRSTCATMPITQGTKGTHTCWPKLEALPHHSASENRARDSSSCHPCLCPAPADKTCSEESSFSGGWGRVQACSKSFFTEP